MIVHTIVVLVLGMLVEVLVRVTAAVVLGVHNAAVAAMAENAVLWLRDFEMMAIVMLESPLITTTTTTVMFQTAVMLFLVLVHRVIAVSVVFGNDGVRIQGRGTRQNDGNLMASKFKAINDR